MIDSLKIFLYYIRNFKFEILFFTYVVMIRTTLIVSYDTGTRLEIMTYFQVY